MKVENAVIMAAGASSRFAPLSYERHKALTEVRGEILLERQIRQLLEAKVPEIFLITGYKAEQFAYLKEKYGVHLIHNPDYLCRNNNSSIHAAREILGNSYLCSSDNYFLTNPFEEEVPESYYAAEYAEGETAEWCMEEDETGRIRKVTVGGKDAWYMMGHAFWSREFSCSFLRILEEEYDRPETEGKLWEAIFLEHLEELPMKIRKYPPGQIFEFDTLDELRAFDPSYVKDTRSLLLKKAARELSLGEDEIREIRCLKGEKTDAEGFSFQCPKGAFRYWYRTGRLEQA